MPEDAAPGGRVAREIAAIARDWLESEREAERRRRNADTPLRR